MRSRSPSNASEVSSESPAKDIASCTVLLVDDDSHILHSLYRGLREQPFGILTARSSEEAIGILKGHTIDLVVSDECMPGICGSELCSWIEQEFPSVERIILTGNASVQSAQRAINEGRVSHYFTKPCDLLELALAIRQRLEVVRGTSVI